MNPKTYTSGTVPNRELPTTPMQGSGGPADLPRPPSRTPHPPCIAGCVGGASAKCTASPGDTMKLHVQNKFLDLQVHNRLSIRASTPQRADGIPLAEEPRVQKIRSGMAIPQKILQASTTVTRKKVLGRAEELAIRHGGWLHKLSPSDFEQARRGVNGRTGNGSSGRQLSNHCLNQNAESGARLQGPQNDGPLQ